MEHLIRPMPFDEHRLVIALGLHSRALRNLCIH